MDAQTMQMIDYFIGLCVYNKKMFMEQTNKYIFVFHEEDTICG